MIDLSLRSRPQRFVFSGEGRALPMCLRIVSWSFVLFALFFTCPLHAEITEAEVDEGFVELFDNHSLMGWQSVDRESWRAGDAVLVSESGAGWLHTAAVYDDFILRLELRLDAPDGEARIWFGAADGRGKRRPEEAHRVSMTAGTGGSALTLAGGERHELDSSALKPTGQWNQCEIRCRGGEVEVVLNGRGVARNERLDPTWGFLGLEAARGNVAFRHLRIRELGGRPMFARGGGLSGWQIVGSGEEIWSITDEGYLVCSGEPGGWISTIDEFDHFTLSLEYKLEPGGNSGVYIRAPHEGRISRMGMEIQVLDDGAKKYEKLKPYQYTGSIYAVVPPARRVIKPAGQWNRLQIQCSRRQVSTWVNGRLMVSVDLDDFEELAERPRKGYIGFQNHRSRILYRNVLLKSHPAGQGGTP